VIAPSNPRALLEVRLGTCARSGATNRSAPRLRSSRDDMTALSATMSAHTHGFHSYAQPDELCHLTHCHVGQSSGPGELGSPLEEETRPLSAVRSVTPIRIDRCLQSTMLFSKMTAVCLGSLRDRLVFQATRQRSVHSERWLRRAREHLRGVVFLVTSFERTSDTPSLRGLPVERHRHRRRRPPASARKSCPTPGGAGRSRVEPVSLGFGARVS
jgi:hypothetical protein